MLDASRLASLSPQRGKGLRVRGDMGKRVSVCRERHQAAVCCTTLALLSSPSPDPFHEPLGRPPGFGLRQSSGAFGERPNDASLPKAPEDWRSPRRYRAGSGVQCAKKSFGEFSPLNGERGKSACLGKTALSS